MFPDASRQLNSKVIDSEHPWGHLHCISDVILASLQPSSQTAPAPTSSLLLQTGTLHMLYQTSPSLDAGVQDAVLSVWTVHRVLCNHCHNQAAEPSHCPQMSLVPLCTRLSPPGPDPDNYRSDFGRYSLLPSSPSRPVSGIIQNAPFGAVFSARFWDSFMALHYTVKHHLLIYSPVEEHMSSFRLLAIICISFLLSSFFGAGGVESGVQKCHSVLPASKAFGNSHRGCLGAQTALEQLFFLHLGVCLHITFLFCKLGPQSPTGLGSQDPDEITHWKVLASVFHVWFTDHQPPNHLEAC